MKSKILVGCMALLLVGGLMHRSNKMVMNCDSSMQNMATIVDAQDLIMECLCIEHDEPCCPCVRVNADGTRSCVNPQLCRNKMCPCYERGQAQ